MKNIAILGFGTVGSGVYEVVKENSDVLKDKTGHDICVKRVLDLRKFPGHEVERILTDNFDEILSDPDIDVVVEVMGGIEPAFTFSRKALEKGKSVVTSNKALVAKHGPELLKTAKENNVSYLFEASVGGAIPILRPLAVCLTADRIEEIYGILNGTTNYILSKMASEGEAFEDVLKTAQKLGYAEADPTADVEGHDACRKIAILSSIAFGGTVNFEEIYTEGISKITSADIDYAKEAGLVIKLIASSKKTESGVKAIVSPCLLRLEHPLASVNDAYNAIFVKGNMSGNTMYYGSGAGKLPTASAVMADVVDVILHEGSTVAVHWEYNKTVCVENIMDCPVNAIVRAAFSDRDKARGAVKDIFDEAEFISVDKYRDEFAFISGEQTEKGLLDKIERLKMAGCISEIRNVIRMEG
ncbi:homoserine dehydrogenase [Anaerotignum faecicola]|nr:homoserine dehydrogenase [Anaerotignum faecicola]